MKYEYTIIYRIKGIEHKGLIDIELLPNSYSQICTILTKNPDRFTNCNNEIVKVLATLIKHLEQNAPKSPLIEQLRNYSTLFFPKFEDMPHIVTQIRGDCGEVNGKTIILETEDFVAYLNANDPTESIRSECEYAIAAVLTSLALETGGSVMPEKVCDTFVLYRDDGKRVIPFNYIASIEVTDDGPLVEDAPVRIADCYRKISSNKNKLGIVAKFLKLSLETEKDTLRSFLFGWSALEIFVNTVFRKYEDALFTKLLKSPMPELCPSYVDKIRKVMKNKYTLTDKFSLVASGLCVTDAEKDIEEFQKTNKQRNSLFHGSKINESELPTNSAHKLLIKYLQLHLGGDIRPPTIRKAIKISGQHDPFGISAK